MCIRDRLEPYVIERRRHFHAYPELSAREVSTSRTIAEELDKLGVEYVLSLIHI